MNSFSSHFYVCKVANEFVGEIFLKQILLNLCNWRVQAWQENVYLNHSAFLFLNKLNFNRMEVQMLFSNLMNNHTRKLWSSPYWKYGCSHNIFMGILEDRLVPFPGTFTAQAVAQNFGICEWIKLTIAPSRKTKSKNKKQLRKNHSLLLEKFLIRKHAMLTRPLPDRDWQIRTLDNSNAAVLYLTLVITFWNNRI